MTKANGIQMKIKTKKGTEIGHCGDEINNISMNGTGKLEPIKNPIRSERKRCTYREEEYLL